MRKSYRGSKLANADDFIRRLPDGYDTVHRPATAAVCRRVSVSCFPSRVRRLPIRRL